MMYKGDIGIVLRYIIDGEDLTSATDLRLKYIKPDGVTGYWNAVLEGKNVLKYTTLSTADLDQAGQWTIQPYVVQSGFSGHADPKNFDVTQTIF